MRKVKTAFSSGVHILVAAAGPYLHTFDVYKGVHLSTWPSPHGAQFLSGRRENSEISNFDIAGTEIGTDEFHHPCKRQKILPAEGGSEKSSAEMVVERNAYKTSRALNPPIVKLAATRNGHHVVAVTSEDKCIRVFALSTSGILTQFSERCMPKRPCAIQMTTDDTIILCADKFGDVYALPLMGQTYETAARNEKANAEISLQAKDEVSELFIPSATSLTVHTKRNREALRQQQNMTKKKLQKNPMFFDHQLILGHVSLLTDIACASLEDPAGKLREYILSADRDEHIRISRGIPQAHVIEGYCLGHTQFVSRLCLLPYHPRLMVSGGGDEYLLLWDWPAGHIRQHIELRELVDMCRRSLMSSAQSTIEGQPSCGIVDGHTGPIAVSNICALALSGHEALFTFALSPEARIEYLETQVVEGDIIDTVVLPDHCSVICSLDLIHEPLSTSLELSGVNPSHRPCVVAKRFTSQSQRLQEDVTLQNQLVPAMEACVKQQPFVTQENKESLKELLYGLESLRKRASDAHAGRYLPEYHQAKGDNDFFACCRSPEIASTLTLQPITRYAGLIDAAIIFSDILVIPQAMGMTVEMLDGKGPHFPTPLKSPTDGQYQVLMARAVDVGRELSYVYEAITLTRKKLEGRVPLFGFCGAPWTLLCYMVEGGGTKLFKESKTWIYRYAEESKRLLRKISELCVEYLALQVKAGAQIVQVFDSWAAELSPSTFREFALPELRHISSHLPVRLRKMGVDLVPMVVFAKGAWYALDELCESGYQVVGLDWLQDPADAVRIADERVCLQGNMDPGVLYGGKEAITRHAKEMADGFFGERKGWIANLGHGVTPYVDPEKLKFFFEEIHRLTKDGESLA
ncbi:MAG: hypothetical protein Q9163_002805 [Psora crenata]